MDKMVLAILSFYCFGESSPEAALLKCQTSRILTLIKSKTNKSLNHVLEKLKTYNTQGFTLHARRIYQILIGRRSCNSNLEF